MAWGSRCTRCGRIAGYPREHPADTGPGRGTTVEAIAAETAAMVGPPVASGPRVTHPAAALPLGGLTIARHSLRQDRRVPA
ncbi:hypothetical protein [Amycolatopsis plumensis]|uniref:hypothetical protein n=1 Tax=Amycolatopsis plumensis TaxID=236508 RepID=UPI003620E8E4